MRTHVMTHGKTMTHISKHAAWFCIFAVLSPSFPVILTETAVFGLPELSPWGQGLSGKVGNVNFVPPDDVPWNCRTREAYLALARCMA